MYHSLRAHLAGHGHASWRTTLTWTERLRGCFADGWTPADIARVATLIPDVHLVCVWAHATAYGPDGHAELGLAQGEDLLHAPIAAVGAATWEWLVEGAPFAGMRAAPEQLLVRSEPRIVCDGHNLARATRP